MTWQNVPPHAPMSAGACGQHGAYVGLSCGKCVTQPRITQGRTGSLVLAISRLRNDLELNEGDRREILAWISWLSKRAGVGEVGAPGHLDPGGAP